ncbi:MAG: hypothetical protein WCS06_09700 [Dysgonamonadaceae bacterium]
MKIKTNQIKYFLLGIILSFNTFSLQSQELKKGIHYTQHKFIPFYNFKKAGNTIIFQGNKKKKIILKVGILKWLRMMDHPYLV